MASSFDSILKDLKKKIYKPVYFLHGDESYFIDIISDYIEKKVLDEGEKAFNQLVLYGRETNFKSVVDSARQFPMMAPYKVIIIKEAQVMRDIISLDEYVKNPSPQTLLVLAYKHKKLDKRSKFSKAIYANAEVLESNKIKDYTLGQWISNQVKGKGFNIGNEVTQLLAEYLGNDLSKVNNAIEKLVIDLSAGGTINMDAVQNKIGISKDYNVFEMQKALGERNVLKASKIINYMVQNSAKQPLIMLNSMLYGYFTKVMGAIFYKNLGDNELAKKIGLYNTYFLKDYRSAARNYSFQQVKTIFSYLKEFDAKSKGINARSSKGGELTKELLYRILYIQ